jgi:hypothetical protein
LFIRQDIACTHFPLPIFLVPMQEKGEIMNRLHFVEPEDARETTREIFKELVLIPNLLCIMANSEAATTEKPGCRHQSLSL